MTCSQNNVELIEIAKQLREINITLDKIAQEMKKKVI